jgi:hypothetical protein
MANGETLTQICRDKTMPCYVTIRNWALDLPEFATAFTRARKLQVEYWVDEAKDIADDGKNDFIKKEARNGKKFIALDSEHVHRSRLRIDVIKYLASVHDPQKYAQRNTADVEAFGGAIAKGFAAAVELANGTSAEERRRIAQSSERKTTH